MTAPDAVAVSTYVRDLLERVVSTFIQAGVAAGAAAWAASGLDVSQVVNISSAEKVGEAAVIGGLAGVLSLLKGLYASSKGQPGTASLVKPKG